MKTITIRDTETEGVSIRERTNLRCDLVDVASDRPPQLRDRENVEIVAGDGDEDDRLYEIRHQSGFGEGMMSPKRLAAAIGANPQDYHHIHRVLFVKKERYMAYVMATSDKHLSTLFGDGFRDADEVVGMQTTHLFEEQGNYPKKKHGSWVRFVEFDGEWRTRLGLIYSPPDVPQEWPSYGLLAVPVRPNGVEGILSADDLRDIYGPDSVVMGQVDDRWQSLELIAVHAKRVFVPEDRPTPEEFAHFYRAFQQAKDHPMWTQALVEYSSRFKANPRVEIGSSRAKVIDGPLQGSVVTVEKGGEGAVEDRASVYVHGPDPGRLIHVAPSFLRYEIEAMDRVEYTVDGTTHIGWVLSTFHSFGRKQALIRDARSASFVVRPYSEVEHADPRRRIEFIPYLG
ncbi:hypothetical protein MD484_g7732, partial [Candolleomyces efflorescens]